MAISSFFLLNMLGFWLKGALIGFQIMILARPEGGIRVRRTDKYVVEDSD